MVRRLTLTWSLTLTESLIRTWSLTPTRSCAPQYEPLAPHPMRHRDARGTALARSSLHMIALSCPLQVG